MRFALYCGASILCAAGLLINASQRPNIYAASVVLSQSTSTLLALGNFAIMCLIIIARLLVWLFFGELRVIEINNLHERGWYTLTENVISLAMLDHEIDQQFAFCIIALMFSRVFHWICRDRSELIFQTANGGSRFNHARLVAVFLIIHFCDITIIRWCFIRLAEEGPRSIFLLVVFEFILSLQSLHTALWKYLINVIERWYLIQNPEEDIWEKKTDLLFIVDNISNITRLVLFLLEFWIMLKPYGVPVHVLRDLYITIKDLFTRISDRIKFKRATRELDLIIVEATIADIEHDSVCIICREDMQIILDQPHRLVPKKLMCGHVLHHGCLKDWLERSQRCPTCRAEVKIPSPQAQSTAIDTSQLLIPPVPAPQPGAIPQPTIGPQPTAVLQPTTGFLPEQRLHIEEAELPGGQAGVSTYHMSQVLQPPASLTPLAHPAPAVIAPKTSVFPSASNDTANSRNTEEESETMLSWSEYPLNLDLNGAVTTVLPSGLKAVILNPLNDQQREESHLRLLEDTVDHSFASATANNMTQLYNFDPSTSNFVRAGCVGKPRVTPEQEAIMSWRKSQIGSSQKQEPRAEIPSVSFSEETKSVTSQLKALEARLGNFEQKQETIQKDIQTLISMQQENSTMMYEVLKLFRSKSDEEFDSEYNEDLGSNDSINLLQLEPPE
ncbi:hypothetical protein NADFUDRAFT_84469 [Nadsonia fulvescens var. elongata DSM 6958]|uniref:RING-type E3 ubiquitin transferase n=1 Tax=Nadsonia fulvescens var. elongata DSM 6958 TaxID=857566 RepID=A0A1E3PD02_9ASCO|nr:hypothetical protein NADFUDRAFT_84469 [Nadsonia fulvescens var. elongata DSM 6958]